MNILENYPLGKLNTFHLDASARYYTEIESAESLVELLSNDRFQVLRKLVLGGGSNILLTKNVDGLVIKNNIKGIELIREDDNYYYIKAAAGEVWHEFVLHCIEQNYAGIENLSLIPGNVGAGPMQNIGAYGVELKDVFEELEAVEIATKKSVAFSKNDCRFGYRESIFKHEAKDRFVIVSATLRLTKRPVYNISYGAIEKELENMGVNDLSIAAVSRAVCNIRSSRLPDPQHLGNAGSFFKNPVVSNEKAAELKKDFPHIVTYPNFPSGIKLAAGWLIEQCGWKGKRLRDAGVHAAQALVLVNYGKAKGNEIFDLSQKILESVKEKFGVELEREVNII